jgi:hypothetical protein
VEPSKDELAAVGRARRRSLLAGCGVLLVLLLVLAAVAAVAGYYVVSEVNRYTSAAPQPIPRHEPEPGEKDALERRIREFEGRKAPASLELTARDLNTLLVQAAGGTPPPVHARIEENGLFIDASIPLGRNPLLARFFPERYLNASIGLDLLIDEEGRLRARVKSAIAGNGERIPDNFLKFLDDEDLLGEFLEEGKLLPPAGTSKMVAVTPRAVVLEK